MNSLAASLTSDIHARAPDEQSSAELVIQAEYEDELILSDIESLLHWVLDDTAEGSTTSSDHIRREADLGLRELRIANSTRGQLMHCALFGEINSDREMARLELRRRFLKFGREQ